MAKIKNAPGMRSSRMYSAENYRCQKCLEVGHFTYGCTGKRKYVSRPTHTSLLNKRLKTEDKEGEVPESSGVPNQKEAEAGPLNTSEQAETPEKVIAKDEKTSGSSNLSEDSSSEDSESDSSSSSDSSSNSSSSSSSSSSSGSSSSSSSSASNRRSKSESSEKDDSS